MTWNSRRWDLIWAAVKDAVLTGTGVALILSQVWSASPSDILLATGLALTVPSVAGHVKVLLDNSNGKSAPPSSPSTPPSGSSPSGSSSQAGETSG